MAVTLQQIADESGVSRGTVDRALNNRGRINPEVAERIKRIAREMGYQPNRAGRALAMSRHSIKIGVILQSIDTPFMQQVKEGAEAAKEEARRMGAEVEIKEIKGVDASCAISYMEDLRLNGCNAIALVPSEDELLKATVDTYVREYQIPVVTFNSDIAESKRLCFIGQDTLQSGRTAAGLMSEIIRQDGKVLVISGYPTNQGHKNRARGFMEELRKCREDIELLDIKYAYDDDWVAEKIAEEALKTTKELAGIYLTASGVEGVCKVIEQYGISGRVKVISNDLTGKNEEYLRKGTIQFLLGQDPFAQGNDSVMILFHKLFDGLDPEKEYNYTEIVIKNRYNV